MIRATKHTLKFANTGKRSSIDKLLAEWRRVMQLICADMWLNGYRWKEDDYWHEFNPAQFKYELPKYLDYNRFNMAMSTQSVASLKNR